MEALSNLAIYGPLGVWCIVATGAVAWLYRDNGRLRDLGTAATAKLNDEHAAAVAKLNAEHAAAIRVQHEAYVEKLDDIADKAAAAATTFTSQVKDLGASHAAALQSQADRYERQMSEMQQRTFAIVSTLTDKMSALADSITRGLAAR